MSNAESMTNDERRQAEDQPAANDEKRRAVSKCHRSANDRPEHSHAFGFERMMDTLGQAMPRTVRLTQRGRSVELCFTDCAE
jgi:hypothetical protein